MSGAQDPEGVARHGKYKCFGGSLAGKWDLNQIIAPNPWKSLILGFRSDTPHPGPTMWCIEVALVGFKIPDQNI